MDSQWSNLDLIYHGILSSVLKLLYCLKKESVISPSPPIVLVILGTICCCWWWFLQSSTRVSAFTLFDLGSLLFFLAKPSAKVINHWEKLSLTSHLAWCCFTNSILTSNYLSLDCYFLLLHAFKPFLEMAVLPFIRLLMCDHRVVAQLD